MKALDILCASPRSTAICLNLQQRPSSSSSSSSLRKLQLELQHSSRFHVDVERQEQEQEQEQKQKQDQASLSLSKGGGSDNLNALLLDPSLRKDRPRRSIDSSCRRRRSNVHVGDAEIISSRRSSASASASSHRRSSSSSKMSPPLPPPPPPPPPAGSGSRRSSSAWAYSNISLGRFSCSAIDSSAIVPYQRKHSPMPLSPELSVSSTPDKIVVLRVSLHCPGCAMKVRKHISKMEGVTSISIDLPKQKVTVAGNVTPLAVLQNVSRVKNAELWPTTSSKAN